MKLTRPIVRYHGGKWMLAPWIIENLPPHHVYVEPFGGGASVLLRKPRSYAEVYNDLDGEIVSLFRVAREQGPCLVQQLRLTPFSRSEFQLAYVPTDDPMEQARRTVIRAFMGFGSNAHNKATGFRSNSNRSGTTPAHDWANYPDALNAIVERLQGVVIENRDAFTLIPQHDSDRTLFYIDPPYVQSTRNKGDDYRHELNDNQHADLAALLRSLKGMVVLSGYPSAMYEELYAGWVRIDRNAHADGARDRIESLWMNHAAGAMQLQQRLIA